MTTRQMRRRVGMILVYEPSWFAESMSAFGIVLWSLLAFATDDYQITQWSLAMPGLGMVIGPTRLFLLLRLTPLPRVIAGMVGFVWWAWLSFAAFLHWGFIPGIGPMSAIAIGDLLTVGKFSLDSLWKRADG